MVVFPTLSGGLKNYHVGASLLQSPALQTERQSSHFHCTRLAWKAKPGEPQEMSSLQYHSAGLRESVPVPDRSSHPATCRGQGFVLIWMMYLNTPSRTLPTQPHSPSRTSSTHRVMERIFNHIRHMDVNVCASGFFPRG